MAPIMASAVVQSDEFQKSLVSLRGKYPHIDEEVDDLQELLRFDYQLPPIPVSKDLENVFAIRLDYPALGERGLGLFLVTYHSTPANPNPASPYKMITMLTIELRTKRTVT